MRTEDLEKAIDHMVQKTKDLRRQLRKAVVDHVSDSFLASNVPLLVLIEAAKNGDERQVKEYAQVGRHGPQDCSILFFKFHIGLTTPRNC